MNSSEFSSLAGCTARDADEAPPARAAGRLGRGASQVPDHIHIGEVVVAVSWSRPQEGGHVLIIVPAKSAERRARQGWRGLGEGGAPAFSYPLMYVSAGVVPLLASKMGVKGAELTYSLPEPYTLRNDNGLASGASSAATGQSTSGPTF